MCYIMRPLIFKLLFLLNFSLVDAYGQDIIANTCDSILLSKEEYEKCKSDTAWTADIAIKINYISILKTNLLPKYRLIRKRLKLSSSLQNSLQRLKIIYDTCLNKKLFSFQTEMDKNQKYVQPKSYLSSLLSFQVFKFYPDIHAILLNSIHLQLTPKTTTQELKSYKQHFDKIIKSIPADLYQELMKITTELSRDNAELMKQGFTSIFQGSIQEGYRNQCNIVNFLLWTE
jgi:hypothetical protein